MSNRPPASTPERAAPYSSTRPPGQPIPKPPPRPTSSPEGRKLAGTPQPLAGTAAQDPTPLGQSGARPIPKAVRTTQPRVPPKPVRKKSVDQSPVIRQQKESDRTTGPNIIPAPTPLPAPTSSLPSDNIETKAAEAKSVETQIDSTVTQSAKNDTPVSVPIVAQNETSMPPHAAKTGVKPYPPAQRPLRKKTKPQNQVNRPAIFSMTVGGVVVLLLVCVVCSGGAGWFAFQSERGNTILASLGFFDDEDIAAIGDVNPETAAATLTTEFVLSSPTPIDTATLPPTFTPTPLPPTHTPLPTDTPTPPPSATPVPAPTEAPPPTDTPIPTATPLPPDTPTPAPPAATATPEESPTPEISPTPAMKYEAPLLQEPAPDAEFNGGNTIVLRWQPVGELAPDEQYAVRMIYNFNGQPTYQGGQTKATEWNVPLSLFGKIDPPDNRYEWFVVVERLNDDGSGTPISPESERQNFTWK